MRSSALQGISIIYFGNEWAAENRTSSHHIASRLPEYCPILYVDSPGLRAPTANRRDVRRLFRKLAQILRAPVRVADNLWHCTIPQIPFRRLPGVDRFNRLFGRWALNRAVRSVGFGRRISWFVVPHPGFLAGSLGEELVVYYCIDDYAAHPGVDAGVIEAADRNLTAKADIVFVAPPALFEMKRVEKQATLFSPHGVDFDLFARATLPETPTPALTASLEQPVIGFFGSIADWIDTELLAKLGRERPKWTFLMVGHASTDISGLRKLPNFVFVGAQPYRSLPEWAKAFDVAIIPYRKNRQVANANPLKLREYLATGRPVVSVSTMEIGRFADFVYVADTPEAFLSSLEMALAEDSEAKRHARMDAVKEMSWDARVRETLQNVILALELKHDSREK